MGYSKNRDVLEARLDALDALKAGEDCKFDCEPGTESREAFKIREALYIASLFYEEYPELARAHRDFSVSIEGPGVVSAKRKFPRIPRGKRSNERVNPLATFGEIINAIQSTPAETPLNFPLTELDRAAAYNLLALCDRFERVLIWSPPGIAIRPRADHEDLAVSREELTEYFNVLEEANVHAS